MKKLILTASIALLGLTYAQIPNTFVAKAPAKAADVNANFTYLYNQILALQKSVVDSSNSLRSQLNLTRDSLKYTRDSLNSLKSQTATSANLTALQNDVNALKKDSIGALRTANASLQTANTTTNTNLTTLQTSLATYYLKTDADNKFATQTSLGTKADSSTLWKKINAFRFSHCIINSSKLGWNLT